jgi:hypothetical protein
MGRRVKAKRGMQNNSSYQYMQYGCGYTSNREGWLNFDASPTLYLQRIPLLGKLTGKLVRPRFPDNIIFGDILKNLPIEKGSCKGIYCSHVLEHLSLDDMRIALQNTYAYLAPKGVFRLVMPDLDALIHQYIESNNSSASIEFMKDSLLGVTKREKSIAGFFRTYFGNSHHLWLWDFKSAKIELENVGFTKIRRAKFGDSQDFKFTEIEDKTRWMNCLGIECQK